jgi:hypothetical protein
MDEKIKLQVNKIVVHKRIHEYLKQLASKESRVVKVETKLQEDVITPQSEPGEVKEESHASRSKEQ